MVKIKTISLKLNNNYYYDYLKYRHQQNIEYFLTSWQLLSYSNNEFQMLQHLWL